MSNTDLPLFEEDNVTYHFEDVKFDLLHKPILTSWFQSTILSKNRNLGFLNFIFCSDNYLHKLNLQYLEHDTFTDVITFSYSDEKIEGDIFISSERVKENAENIGIPFENELHRVMIHGVLHLLGLKDKTKEDKVFMTKNENDYLAVLNKMILNNK